MEIVSENRFSGKTYFHTIASRLWQIPSLYGFCAVAANVNSALGVKLGSKLTGPVNIKLKPVYLKTIKPAMSLGVKALYCPPAAVTAWGLGTLLGLIPSTG